MSKYIDAELLRKEIESRMGDCDANSKNPNQLLWAELAALIPFIDSLQQEQPSEKTCKNCGFYENNCPYIRGKFIPYPSKVCKDYTYSVIKAQEQPTEDLEKEIEEYWVATEWSKVITLGKFKVIARYFYGLGQLNSK